MSPQRKETVGGIAVYMPTGEVDAESKKLAPRLKNIRDARIGIGNINPARRILPRGSTLRPVARGPIPPRIRAFWARHGPH